MNPRNTALLFLLAAALGAFVYLYEIRGGEQRKEEASAAKRLFPGVEPQAVDRISLVSSDGQEVEAERADGRWRLVKPIAALGDPVALDAMASALAEIQSEATVEAPQPPEVYGLGDGAKTVRFRAQGAEHVLRFGKRTPVGPNTYAATADAAKVFTVPTYRASTFERPLDDLRERRILRFDQNAIESVDVRWPDGHVTVVKKDGAWRLTQPLDGPADEATVEKLLTDVGFLRADGFLDDATPDDQVGLASPDVALELRAKPVGEGAVPATFQLKLGRPLDGNERQRAARAGDGTLYKVAVERIVDVPRNVVAYRYKDVAKFVATDAQRIELTFHDAAEPQPVVVSLSRSDDAGWTSEGIQLVSGKSTRLVAELARLRAADIAADPAAEADATRLGLAPPAAVIRVFGAKTAQDEPRLAEIELGATGAEGTFARPGGGGVIYRLGPELAEHLPTSLAAWRERFVVPPPPAGAGAPEGTKPEGPAAGEAEGNANPKTEEVFPPTTGLEGEAPR